MANECYVFPRQTDWTDILFARRTAD